MGTYDGSNMASYKKYISDAGRKSLLGNGQIRRHFGGFSETML